MLPVLLGLLVVVLAPGGAVLAAAGVRGLPLVALAAPVSAAVLGGGAVLLGLVGIGWQWWAAAVLTAIGSAVAWALAQWHGPPAALREGGRPDGRRPLVVGAVVAAVVGAVPLAAGMRRPDRVPQTWDTVFHLNALRYVEDTGRASSLGLAGLNDQVSGTGFYPAGWHVLVGTVVDAAGVDPAVAANASTLLLGGVVLPLGTGLAARALVPSWRYSAAVGAVAGASFAALPTFMSSFGTLFPNSWATGSLPAVLAAAVLVLRRPDLLSWAVLLVALGGAVLIHPSALFGAGLMGAPFLLAGLLRRWHRLLGVRRGRRVVVEGAVLALVGVAAAVALATSSALDDVRTYPRAPIETMAQAVGEALLDAPLSGLRYGVPDASWILGVLLVAGIVRATTDPDRREWVAGFLLAVGAFAISAGAPADSPFRAYVTGFWYNDPVRLAGQLPVLAAPLVTLGLAAVVHWAAARLSGPDTPRRLRAVPPVVTAAAVPLLLLLVLLATGGGYAGKRADRMTFDYWPANDSGPRQLLTPGEERLLRDLDEQLPEDAVVLADPFNGGALAYALGDRDVVFPHVTGTWSEQGLELRDSEVDPTDADSCRLLEEFGVTHLYVDSSIYRQGSTAQVRFAALDEVPDTGVRLTARADGAALYEVTGCS